MSTPAVSGVTEVFRSNLSNEIMLARLEAYNKFQNKNSFPIIKT